MKPIDAEDREPRRAEHEAAHREDTEQRAQARARPPSRRSPGRACRWSRRGRRRRPWRRPVAGRRRPGRRHRSATSLPPGRRRSPRTRRGRVPLRLRRRARPDPRVRLDSFTLSSCPRLDDERMTSRGRRGRLRRRLGCRLRRRLGCRLRRRLRSRCRHLGSGVGVASSLGVAVAGGGEHGTAATSDPDGDGISNDGITPLSSGCRQWDSSSGMGSANRSHRVATNTPQVRPYGWNSGL